MIYLNITISGKQLFVQSTLLLGIAMVIFPADEGIVIKRFRCGSSVSSSASSSFDIPANSYEVEPLILQLSSAGLEKQCE